MLLMMMECVESTTQLTPTHNRRLQKRGYVDLQTLLLA